MANDIEALGHLTQIINGLGPEQVPGEITPLLEHGSRSLIARIITGNQIEPVLGVLGSIEGALGQVGSPKDRTSLGEKAVGTVVDTLRGEHFQPDSPNSSLALVEQASRFAELIEDPREKAIQLRNISAETARVCAAEVGEAGASDMGWYSNIYLNKAAVSAQGIDDLGARSFTLSRIAETAAENASQLVGGISKSDDEHHMLTVTDLLEQPAWLYERALVAADTIKDPAERNDQKAELALSMAQSAAKTGEVAPELSGKLANMAMKEIADVLAAYRADGERVKLSPAEKCRGLVDLGSKLARIIDEDHNPSDQNKALRQQLAGQTINVFRAARVYSEELSRSHGLVKGRFAPNRYNLAGSSSNTATAAGRLVGTNFGVAKELFEIGFGFAVIQAKLGGRHSRDISSVLDTIGSYAKSQTNIESGFDLYSLAHHQLNQRLAGDKVSHIMEVNARRALLYLSEAPIREMALEKIDRGFIEFIVRVATTDSHVSWISDLHWLGRYIADPELKQTVDKAIENLRTREEAARRPRSETARIAQEIVGGR